MMNTSKSQIRAGSFIDALRRAGKDRGKMAALRRALSPQNQMDAWPIIADLGGDIECPAYTVIGALYATHPKESKTVNFGSTCREIALQDSGDGKLPESCERRFRRLLAAGSSEQLGELLRAWIRLAASKGVGVNYEQLFTDLWNWEWRADDIRVRWATKFWPARKTEETPVPEETPL